MENVARKSKVRRLSAGFSLPEVVVVLGIVGMLAGLIFGAIARARENAHFVVCKSQLHQIGISLAGYAAADKGAVVPFEGGFPHFSSRDWPRILFGDQAETTACPVRYDGYATFEPYQTYQLSSWVLFSGISLGASRPGFSSSEILLGAENPLGIGYELGFEMSPTTLTSFEKFRHGQRLGSNYLWLDLHVSSEEPKLFADTDSMWQAW